MTSRFLETTNHLTFKNRLIKYLLAALFAISSGIYLNILNNSFVFDEAYLIKANKWITDFRYIPEILRSSSWSFIPGITSGTYRPFQIIFYIPIYYIFGLDPFGFHLVSILIHGANTLLVFFVIASVLEDFDKEKKGRYFSFHIPFFSALVFGLHPIHSENVAWAAGMVDLVNTFLLLGSFYFYSLWRRNISSIFNLFFFLSNLLFFASLFFKEISLTFPAILIAYDMFINRFSFSLKRLLVYLPFSVYCLFYLLIRFAVIGTELGAEIRFSLSGFQNIINIFPLLTMYIVKIVAPVNLSAYYGFNPVYSLWEIKSFISLLFIISLFTVMLYSFMQKRLIFFLLIWTIIPLLPVVYIPLLGRTIFADRYLYLPSVGLISLIVFLGFKFYEHINFFLGKTILVISFSALLILFSWITLKRTYVWKDEFTLWSDTVKQSPDSYLPLNKLGAIYLSQKDWAKSALYLGKAVEIQTKNMPTDPSLGNAFSNLGVAWFNLGKTDEAEISFKKALSYNQADHLARYGLGMVYTRLNKRDEAIREFLLTLKIKPDYKRAAIELEKLTSK